MEYYFNNLDPTSFQRLVNGILVARYGENVRLTPLRGADGGRDAETAPGNPYFEYQVVSQQRQSFRTEPRAGRYLFQVKHHRTLDVRLSDARASVIADFERELKANVLPREDDERVNYFFLITNVPSSRDSILAVDHKRRALLKDFPNLHTDVWWQEAVTALLDQTPSLWSSFPEMFAGGKVPFLTDIVNKSTSNLPRAVRAAIGLQYQRDSVVKFKQIELEKSLTKLFVDLDVDLRFLDGDDAQFLIIENTNRRAGISESAQEADRYYYPYSYRHNVSLTSALGVLLNENNPATQKILLEGGPGQGKSTITQMMAQIYRSEVLLRADLNPEGRWFIPEKKRLPLRMELRHFAEWLGDHPDGSVEAYLAEMLHKDSGGSQVTVDDIHNMVENSPVLLIFDGLDEVGSADLRDEVLLRVTECIDRFETSLHTDLRVIVTTRPPAIAGRREQLINFSRLPIAPMESQTIANYLNRWLSVQVFEEGERNDIRTSFERRKNETHVAALAKNPMQLSVLLHFIRLKGEAFPDRRAELYRDYFRTVIDRDVEKSSELRQKREVIETLHQLLGYKIHSLTEADKADGTLRRPQLLEIIQNWMSSQVSNPTSGADEIFRLGEERLGLIVALRGEGEEARYGYEIQPIREYFAAAFITEQIQGEAHEVFESLIYRSYWKEVALFLAGLRRPNEKADLIARAKAVERNPEIGWRRDGRTIILQLLQEGVFSQPRHVFSEAVDFIIDALDPALVSAPSEPKEVVDVLPNLIEQGEKERHIHRILKIAERYVNVDDAQIHYRIYRVLSRLIPSDDLIALLLRNDALRPDLLVLLRLYWPTIWGVNVQKIASRPEYWECLHPDLVATYLWKAGLSTDLGTGILFPESIHAKLFERYALYPHSIFDRVRPDGITVIEPRSNWAVWHIVSLQQCLLSAALGVQPSANVTSSALAVDECKLDGLSSDLTQMLGEIIPVLRELVVAAIREEQTVTQLFSNYISSLVRYLNVKGLTGLIACRTAIYVVQLYRLAGRHVQTKPPSLVNVLRSDAGLAQLSLELLPFFGFDRSSPRISAHSLSLVMQRTHDRGGIPTHMRVDNDGQFVLISKLLAENILKNNHDGLLWLEQLPITSSRIRFLVNECGSNLEGLLLTLSERQFEVDNSARPLLVQKTQKILKAARATNNPKLLEGTLVALSSSKFLNLAGPHLTLKLVASARSKLSIVQNLFLTRRQDSRELYVLNELAKLIIQNPTDFQVGTAVAAAGFLSEHLPVRQPPLITLEEELGLKMQQRSELN